MDIALPDVLLDEKNKEFWHFKGCKAIVNDNAPDEVKKACMEHNKNMSEYFKNDSDILSWDNDFSKGFLKEGSEKLGIELSDNQIDTLIKYKEILVEWNEKINLTAITDDFGVYTKHFLDSLTTLLTGKVKGNVIDVGTGAGFPGLVLKIAKPEIKLTLLDSLNKRINFLKEASGQMGLDDINFVHARAEDGARREREKFDTVVSRAVANMTVLAELCLPFVKVGGYFLALKGPMAEEELEGAKRAITILGGEISEIFSAEIPFTDLSHKIIIIKKVRHTPMQYPRKAGIPSKTPIESCYNLKKNAKK